MRGNRIGGLGPAAGPRGYGTTLRDAVRSDGVTPLIGIFDMYSAANALTELRANDGRLPEVTTDDVAVATSIELLQRNISRHHRPGRPGSPVAMSTGR